MTKTEFAGLANVSKSAVSNWIRDGKLPADCLVGEGRMARIDVARATAALRKNLDVGQRFGNGIATRLPLGEAGPAAPAVDPVEERIKAEKLREIEFRNRAAAKREAEEAGLYVRTDQARAATAKAVGTVLTELEAALPEMANALAARFELPARDVVHELRQRFREARGRLAGRLADQAAALADELEDELLAPGEVTKGTA